MNKKSKILVTGAGGMVGKTLVNELKIKGFLNLLTPNSKELNLKNKEEVEHYFMKHEPEYVFHLAAKVGGIKANMNYPAEFLYENLFIQSNVIEASRKFKVKKLLFLGSSCIYPKDSPQPMSEDLLLSNKLEPTNEAYAIAKIAGLKMCEYYNKQYGTNFISLMPCNLYGYNDHFEPENSHVISALILKFHEAKLENKNFVDVWGSGNPRRELLFVDDVADAMIYFMLNYDAKDLMPFINIGYGEDISIKELAFMIKEIIGYDGEVKFDTNKPDGMLKKLLDVSKAKNLGWKSKTELREGLKKTYEWFKEDEKN